MQNTAFYRKILDVKPPWRVNDVELHEETSEVHVHVEWRADTRFRCPECGKNCPGYDTRTRQWRHLDICEYRTILIAQVPRVQCPEHGVKQVPVPWAESRGHFTEKFEAQVIGWLAEEASISAVARQLGLDWHTVADIMERAVERGIARRDEVAPTRIGIDETSSKKGQNYVTVLRDVDLHGKRWDNLPESAGVIAARGSHGAGLTRYCDQLGSFAGPSGPCSASKPGD